MCGMDAFGSADVLSNHESPNLQDFLKSVGILQELKPPKHKEFATLEARLESFEKCLILLKQNIQTLCKAGLYYRGNVIVFYYTSSFLILMLF